MNKKIFTFIAFAAALIGCSKENNVSDNPLNGAQTLVISATIGTPDTKLSYNPNENGGYTATFNGTERLQMYFLDAKDSTLQRSLVSIDPYSISDDGKTANFVVSNLEVPAAVVKIFSYIDFTSAPVTYTDTLNVNDLSLQSNLAAAQSHHILVGSVNVSDLTSTEPGKVAAVIKYAYKTSLLRFNLTLPVRPSADAKTVISISNKNSTIHKIVNFAKGELTASSSSTGDIVIYPSAVDTNTNTATAYACVWASDNFKDTRVTAKIGDDSYYVDLNLAKETLEAGKVYDVTRSMVIAPRPVDVWMTDDAGTADFIAGGSETLTSDWLSYAAGKVSWTANTTGAPRTAALTFANGSSYKVTQIAPADFKGNYNFTTKIFSNNASFVKAADLGTVSVTFGDPIETELLTEGAKTFTNNIGVRGLYFNDVVSDAVVAIDYAAKSAKFGLFLDGRKAQKCTSLTGTYTYACYLPEMASWTASGWAAPWNLVQADLGTPDYTWLWFAVGDDFKTIKYVNPTIANGSIQRLGHDAAATNDYIIGITVALSSAEEASAASVSTNYDVIYQCNSDLTFTRK